MSIEIDVVGDGVPEWAASFGCTAELIAGQGQHPSYRMRGTRVQLQALLADGGYDPDVIADYDD